MPRIPANTVSNHIKGLSGDWSLAGIGLGTYPQNANLLTCVFFQVKVMVYQHQKGSPAKGSLQEVLKARQEMSPPASLPTISAQVSYLVMFNSKQNCSTLKMSHTCLTRVFVYHRFCSHLFAVSASPGSKSCRVQRPPAFRRVAPTESSAARGSGDERRMEENRESSVALSTVGRSESKRLLFVWRLLLGFKPFLARKTDT